MTIEWPKRRLSGTCIKWEHGQVMCSIYMWDWGCEDALTDTDEMDLTIGKELVTFKKSELVL